jgi:nicotinate-nucleotide adenylyltransferase
MNVALFGGTFDPVHLGHLAVARAAQQRFDLGRIYFVPADVPPHKTGQAITAYEHRYAMLALATAGEKSFVPSTLESPQVRPARGGANYTVDTVRRFRQALKPSDRLFFLIGIDAFVEIASWREPQALLRACEFIVVSRPGFSLADLGKALPEGLRPPAEVLAALQKHAAVGDVVLPGATLHLLPGVASKVSATQIRNAARTGRRLQSLVSPAVAEYIKKIGLYKDSASGRHGARGRAPRLKVLHGGKRT